MEKPKCLICMERDVYDIKSHLTPRAISENTYGEKDKEEIIEIDPKTGTHDIFRGREHPEALPDEIKKQPNVEKGIFCKKCEEALGRLESICHPILLDIIKKLPDGAYKIVIVNGIKTIKLVLPRNVLALYTYSVIWRQGVEQIRRNRDNPFSDEEFERLRQILATEIHKPISEIASSKEFEDYPNVQLITSYFREEFNGFNNPHSYVTNPQLFFISEYICLFWKKGRLSDKMEEIIGLPEILKAPIKFPIENINESTIIVINDDSFQKIIEKLVGKTTDDYLRTLSEKVALFRGIPLINAEQLLHLTARQISGPNPTPKLYHESVEKAFRKLISS